MYKKLIFSKKYFTKSQINLTNYKGNLTFALYKTVNAMKTNYLFPNFIKLPAFIMLGLSVVAGLLSDDISAAGYLKVQVGERLKDGLMVSEYKDYTDTVIGFSIILFSILVAFSKERIEDEYIEKIRLHSLVWATYINYFSLLILFWIFYDFDFLSVMIFNLFTLLWIFIILFNIQKFRLNKLIQNEE